MTAAVVFLGPSAPQSLPTMSSVEVRPSAAAGDIYSAVEEGFTLIGLVDGSFEDRQSVLHDEILHALSRGVPVWGAASLGALRAVECAPFGMRGIGRIFEMYRDGLIEDDHEVAMSHGPEELGAPALSVPLVNIRATLAAGRTDGILSPDQEAQILGQATAIPYKELTWSRLASELTCSLRDVLQSVRALCDVDQKRLDARELLETMESALCQSTPKQPVGFEHQETLFWEENRRRFNDAIQRISRTDAAVLDELRLSPKRYQRYLRGAALRAALHGEFAIDPNPALANGAVEAWRMAMGLTTANDFRNWLVANEIDEEQLSHVLAADSVVEESLINAAPMLARDILDDLRIDGQFAILAERANEKQSTFASPSPQEYDRHATSLPDLIEWFFGINDLEFNNHEAEDVVKLLGLRDQHKLYEVLAAEHTFSLRAIAGGGIS